MSREAWKRQLSDLVVVMGAWAKGSTPLSEIPLDRAMAYRSGFSSMGNGDPSGMLKSFEKRSEKSEWFYVPGYFAAAPIKVRTSLAAAHEFYYPLVAIALRLHGSDLMVAFRVVLFWERDSKVYAWGWRFESPDVEPVIGEFTHPYYHVQHISTWEKDGSGFSVPNAVVAAPLQPAESEHATAESKPAFPVACGSAAGLAVAAIVSLYGPKTAASLLRSSSSIDGEFFRLVGIAKPQLIP